LELQGWLSHENYESAIHDTPLSLPLEQATHEGQNIPLRGGSFTIGSGG